MNTDKLIIRIVNILNSDAFITIFGIWMVLHTIILIFLTGLSNDTYLSFISELAIFTGSLILRDSKIEAQKQKKDLKRDLKKSDEVLEEVKG